MESNQIEKLFALCPWRTNAAMVSKREPYLTGIAQ